LNFIPPCSACFDPIEEIFAAIEMRNWKDEATWSLTAMSNQQHIKDLILLRHVVEISADHAKGFTSHMGDFLAHVKKKNLHIHTRKAFLKQPSFV